MTTANTATAAVTTPGTLDTNNMPSATIAEIVELAPWAHADRRILAIYGKPGIGKTSMAPALCEAIGADFENLHVINLSGYGPQEVVGYGIPDSATRDLWFSRPEFLPTEERVGKDPYVVVFDEFPEWDTQVQALCRGVIAPRGQHPMIGSHRLGRNGLFVITCNRRADGSRSSTVAAPIVSRSVSVVLNPSLDGWLDWAAEEGLASSPIYAFLQFGNTLTATEGVDHFAPDVPQPWKGEAHASPRGWEACARATIEDSEMLENRKLLQLFLRGTVGNASGDAAYAFIQTVNKILPALQEARKNGTVPSDPQTRYALNHAALRIATKEARKDPEAYVVSGSADWLVEIMSKSGGELARWGYSSALRLGLPLDQHPRNRELAGVAAQ